MLGRRVQRLRECHFLWPFPQSQPVLVFVDACVFRDRRSSFEDSEFVASLLCVTGAALFATILWQAQYFRAWAQTWQARHCEYRSTRSRRGAVQT